MMSLDQLGLCNIICCFVASGIIFRILKYTTSSSSGIETTSLRGPPKDSILFGSEQFINSSDDVGNVYERWATEYGPAFKVPGGFGLYKIVIVDPKANAHFYSKETFGYVQSKFARMFIENLVCIPDMARVCYMLTPLSFSLVEVCCGPREKVIEGLSMRSRASVSI
jgi:hypothetical protein